MAGHVGSRRRRAQVGPSAMALHRHVAPHKRPRAPSPPSPPPAPTPVPPPSAAHEIPGPRPLLGAGSASNTTRLVACRTVMLGARKFLLLARHYEHLRRQVYFLHKEQTTRWYVEAQYAVCQRCRPRQRESSRRHPYVGSRPIYCCPPTSRWRKRSGGGTCLKCTQFLSGPRGGRPCRTSTGRSEVTLCSTQSARGQCPECGAQVVQTGRTTGIGGPRRPPRHGDPT